MVLLNILCKVYKEKSYNFKVPLFPIHIFFLAEKQAQTVTGEMQNSLRRLSPKYNLTFLLLFFILKSELVIIADN